MKVIILLNIVLVSLTLYVRYNLFSISPSVLQFITVIWGSLVLIVGYIEAYFLYKLSLGISPLLKKRLELKEVELGWSFAVVAVILITINGLFFDYLSKGALLLKQEKKLIISYLRGKDERTIKKGLERAIYTTSSPTLINELIKIAQKRNKLSPLAVWLLGIKKAKIGESTLVKLLKEGDFETKAASAVALARIGNKKLPNLLSEHIMQENYKESPIKYYIWALTLGKYKEAKFLLLYIIEEDFPDLIKGLSLWGLSELGEENICNYVDRFISNKATYSSCVAVQIAHNANCPFQLKKLLTILNEIGSLEICEKITLEDYFNPPLVVLEEGLYKKYFIRLLSNITNGGETILKTLSTSIYELPEVREEALSLLKLKQY